MKILGDHNKDAAAVVDLVVVDKWGLPAMNSLGIGSTVNNSFEDDLDSKFLLAYPIVLFCENKKGKEELAKQPQK